MTRFSIRKPYHREIFSRHVGEIRSLLHSLEMRGVLEETENRPMMDMYEDAAGVVLEFDLPGFNIDDINLRVCGLMLVLDAYKPRDKNAGALICMERRFGRFHHSVHIPGNVDPCSITAEYRLGVLRVRCPKIDEWKVPIKEITIE